MRKVATIASILVWGSAFPVAVDAQVVPPQDSWAPTNPTGSPSARGGHVVVWTGSEMIVWGGFDGAARPAIG